MQFSSVVGVDANGELTGGPIYYPLLPGGAAIGAGTTSVLSTIAAVEGTTPANATDEVGNLRAINGAVNLGAVEIPAPPPAPLPSKPPITLQPTNQTVTEGAIASFTALASGTPTPTVQWQVSLDFGFSFFDIFGGSGPALTVYPTYYYYRRAEFRAVFTNSAGSVYSNTVMLTINSPPLPPAPIEPPLLQLIDGLLSGLGATKTLTGNANGTETITDSFFGFPLLAFTFYSSSGKLVSVDLFGINITFLFV